MRLIEASRLNLSSQKSVSRKPLGPFQEEKETEGEGKLRGKNKRRVAVNKRKGDKVQKVIIKNRTTRSSRDVVWAAGRPDFLLI